MRRRTLFRRKLTEVFLDDGSPLSLPDGASILVQGFRPSGTLDPLCTFLLAVVVLGIGTRRFLLLRGFWRWSARLWRLDFVRELWITGVRASICLVLLEGTIVTYRPRRRVPSQNLRKYHGRDPHSIDRNLRTRSTKGGRSGLTSDMMIVVGGKVCHSVTRERAKQTLPP